MKKPIRKYSDNRSNAPSMMDRFMEGNFFNNFFDDTSPSVNLKENDKAYTCEISIPGFEKDEVNVNVDGDTLTVSANTQSRNEEKDSDDRIIRQEFKASSFSRSFTLPKNIDTDHIQAKQKNGVLELMLPKQQNALENSSKKISID